MKGMMTYLTIPDMKGNKFWQAHYTCRMVNKSLFLLRVFNIRNLKGLAWHLYLWIIYTLDDGSKCK